MFKVLFFIFLFASCSTVKELKLQPRRVKLTKNLSINTANFLSVIPNKSEVTQLVTYKKDEEVKKMQVVFVKRDILSITVLSLLGIELATLVITEKGIKKISGISNFKVEYFYKVMADILASYAKKKVLYSDIIGDFTISEKANSRDIYQKGEKEVSIKYSHGKSKWLGNIELFNHGYNYKLSIKTLEIKKLK